MKDPIDNDPEDKESEFSSASTSELFEVLGMSKGEAEKSEREMYAIMRRTQIRADNTGAPMNNDPRVEAAKAAFMQANYSVFPKDQLEAVFEKEKAYWMDVALAVLNSRPSGLLDPDMPAQELRLCMGELTASEVRVARAAIRWANTRQVRPSASEDEVERLKEALRLMLHYVENPEHEISDYVVREDVLKAKEALAAADAVRGCAPTAEELARFLEVNNIVMNEEADYAAKILLENFFDGVVRGSGSTALPVVRLNTYCPQLPDEARVEVFIAEHDIAKMRPTKGGFMVGIVAMNKKSEPVTANARNAAERFRRGLADFQRSFWDSYIFTKGAINTAEAQRLDMIIIEALIEGDELLPTAPSQPDEGER